MRHVKNLGLIFLVPILMVFFSCSARIDGAVREGGAAEISLKTSLGPRTAALIGTLRSFMGASAEGPILDGGAISLSLAAAPGIDSVSLKNTSPTSLEGDISITNVGDFLAVNGEKSRFITFSESRAPGNSSIIINLDKESAPEIISRLSPEAKQYLTALMAPAILGEQSTRQEYLMLVAMIYGRPLSDEIASARIQASIEFPRPVTAVRGGTALGKKAEFNIPLVDLLVLETPLRYEISW